MEEAHVVTAVEPVPRPAATPARLIAMARSGRHVVIRRAEGSRLLDGIELVDALGTSPRRAITAEGLVDFGCVGEQLWVIAAGKLLRFELQSGDPIDQPVDIGIDEG